MNANEAADSHPISPFICVHRRFHCFSWRTLASLAVHFFDVLSGKIHFANAPRSLNMNRLGCERSQAAVRRIGRDKISESGGFDGQRTMPCRRVRCADLRSLNFWS